MRKRWLALALSGLILPQLAWSQAPEAALNLPRVSGTLDAKHTMGFISLEHLDDLSAEGLKRLGELPASLREDIPEQIFSPEGRLELLGFEPSTQAGWRAAGIDPIAGITVLFDARIARRGEPQPIFLLKVTDQAAALKVLQRIPGGAQLEPVEGASAATLTLDGERFFIGELGHYTALTPIPNQDEASARARFEAFLSAEGEPLLARVEYKEAMRGQVQSARLFVYGALGGLIEKFRLGKEFDPELFEQIPNFEHYAARFPALGGVFGLEDATTQLVAWGEGLKLLDDLFLVKAPLDLARFVPASGWAAARLSLNAPRLFDSIAALAPPTEQAEVAQEMTKAQAELAKELDITWAQISAALPGHGLIAVDLSTLMAIQMQGPAGLNFLGVATVGDPMWADTLLVKLAAKFEAEAGHKPLRIETQGGQGYSFSADGFTVVLIRAGQTLFAAPNAEAINAALERGKVAVAADAPNAILDALASPFALYVDAGLIIQMVEMFSGMVPEAQEGMTYLKGQPWWKRFSDKPIIAFKIGLERGLRFEGPAMLVGGGAMGLFGAGVGYFMMMPAKMEAPAEIYEVPAKQDMMEIAAPEPIEALEAVEAPVIEQPEPVIEQPEPVIEQPEPVIEQPEPVVEQPKLTLDKAPITHKKPCSKHKAPESAPTTAPASAPVVEQPAPVVEQPKLTLDKAPITHKKPCSKHKAPESAPTTAPASAPVVEQPAPVAAPCPHAAKLDAKEAAPCPHAAKLDAKEAAPCPHAAKLDANKAAPCPHAEACGCQAGCKGECQPNCKGCPLCPKKAEAAAPSPVIPGVNVEHQIGLTKAYLQEARARAIGYFYEHDQRFPPSAPLTPGAPTEAFCAQGAAAPRAEIAWDHPTWQALSFKPIGPHYFAYSFESSGQGVGATFTLRATADLDCDGVPSTFEYKALVDNPNAISFGEGLRVDQPTE